MNCPLCESSEVRRSHARGWEKIPRYLVARKMHRCRDCGHRFGVVSFDPHEDVGTVVIWVGVVLLAAFVFLWRSGQLF
jgi:transcriptional regulator NrdR family protein